MEAAEEVAKKAEEADRGARQTAKAFDKAVCVSFLLELLGTKQKDREVHNGDFSCRTSFAEDLAAKDLREVSGELPDALTTVVPVVASLPGLGEGPLAKSARASVWMIRVAKHAPEGIDVQIIKKRR